MAPNYTQYEALSIDSIQVLECADKNGLTTFKTCPQAFKQVFEEVYNTKQSQFTTYEKWRELMIHQIQTAFPNAAKTTTDQGVPPAPKETNPVITIRTEGNSHLSENAQKVVEWISDGDFCSLESGHLTKESITSICEAANIALSLEPTNEYVKWWVEQIIKEYPLAKSPQSDNPLAKTEQSGSPLGNEPQTTNYMANYYDTTIARPTLLNGEDVADMSEQRCIQLLQANKEAKKTLTDLGVTSVRLQERIADYDAVDGELVKRLDSFAAPAPAAAE